MSYKGNIDGYRFRIPRFVFKKYLKYNALKEKKKALKWIITRFFKNVLISKYTHFLLLKRLTIPN